MTEQLLYWTAPKRIYFNNPIRNFYTNHTETIQPRRLGVDEADDDERRKIYEQHTQTKKNFSETRQKSFYD